MKKFLFDESGQGLAEYGLIIGLVAIAVVAVLALLGDELKVVFNKIVCGLGGTPETGFTCPTA